MSAICVANNEDPKVIMGAFIKSILRIGRRMKYHVPSHGPSKEVTNNVNGAPREELFHRMIRLERKRAERSGKGFLLMLLDVNGGCEIGQSSDFLVKIVEALSSSTRETDIIGWYRNDSLLGVIFTEVDAERRHLITTTISNNSYRALARTVEAERLQNIAVSFHGFPEVYYQEMTHAVSDTSVYPDVARTKSRRRYSLLIKRSVDVAGSALGLVILAPILLMVSVLIKLSSRGPVLVKQRRVGQLGKTFTFLKFRSMYVNRDDEIHREYVKKLIAGRQDGDRGGLGEGGDSPYKMRNDPRVTRIGKLLRRSSLDELPQLLNVLKGEMSLVGPRPPLPYEYECYESWHRCRLLEVKPGITGLWQVKGRSRTTFDEMVRLDMEYTRDWSLWLDIKILLQTPWAVLSGRGAY